MSSPIEQAAALAVGTVESVAPDEIRAVLELDAPQATALNTGRPERFPRLNGFVLIPNETGAVVGLVTWLGVERSSFPKRTGLRDFGLVDLPFPLRKMSLTPLGVLLRRGEQDEARYRLLRGVPTFPSVGDPVLLPTASQLRALVEAQDDDLRVWIGTSPFAADTRVTVDPNKIFGRHLAVLGNTGSGKSCSVAGLIRWSLEAARSQRLDGKPLNARFIVLDPNGEYKHTFDDCDGITEVRSFQAPPVTDARPLRVPAWIWNSQEWSAFAQAAPGTQRPLLLEGLRTLRSGGRLDDPSELRAVRTLRSYRNAVRERIAIGPDARRDFRQRMETGRLLANVADDAKAMERSLDAAREELADLTEVSDEVLHNCESPSDTKMYYDAVADSELERLLAALETSLGALPAPEDDHPVSEDAPLEFKPDELADQLEMIAAHGDYGASSQFLGYLTMRIKAMMADSRLSPIVAPEDMPSFVQWLEDYVGADGASNGELAVLDLSLIPADVLHIVIAVISRVIFESVQRYRRMTGNELPTVLVLEEAHTFIRRHIEEEGGFAAPARMCRETFERIAREGRKFGLGLVLASQRPSELSPTVLAQCNTFLLHRIVNDRDQDLVGRLVPDNLGGLLRELPSLPSRQAVLLGWATAVPVLVQMRYLSRHQRPRSDDPAFWEVWTGESARAIDWPAIVGDWTARHPDEPDANDSGE